MIGAPESDLEVQTMHHRQVEVIQRSIPLQWRHGCASLETWGLRLSGAPRESLRAGKPRRVFATDRSLQPYAVRHSTRVTTLPRQSIQAKPLHPA